MVGRLMQCWGLCCAVTGAETGTGIGAEAPGDADAVGLLHLAVATRPRILLQLIAYEFLWVCCFTCDSVYADL